MSITISKFTLTIGDAMSQDFMIELNGTEFHLDDFMLSQGLMRPNVLTFTLRKDPKEDQEEAQFRTCGTIIGKDVTLSLNTDNIEALSHMSSDEGKTQEVRFKGIILQASGQRSSSEYYITVEARSYDALLFDNPSCKSYEDMTLDQIVDDIVSDYRDDISPIINSRFIDILPYTVQYNEYNYQLLVRLAQRFGEWLYNDGEHLVFGKLNKGEAVTLGYPDKDIPAYNVDLRMQHTAFSHVASSYNANEARIKEGVEEMERDYNTLADLVYNASRERISKSTVQNLHSGSFADIDGRETVLNVSTKTQGRGEKANMATYSGTTYCSRLSIGNILIIKDNYLTNDIVGQSSDVVQDEILITELVHYFSADNTYSNHFEGIPSACDYPPYSNSDVYAEALPCRAKVTDTEDPNHLGRVRVQFDWQAQQADDMMTPWLRISQAYGGKDKGFSFIPEIGEEVMVAFEGGNAERPYIDGMLYNGQDDPDGAWLPGDNQVKAIRTRNGHTIEIWDEGDGGYIRIYDNKKENYVLTFSTDEKLIRLESKGNIELIAQNDIIMRAEHDITASAANDITISAEHDMRRNADNDITERAGNDRTTTIEHNDTLTVESNQFVTINDNRDLQVAHKLQVNAENIRTEAKDKLLQYSKTHQQKASGSMSISAASNIDIKASTVKTN